MIVLLFGVACSGGEFEELDRALSAYQAGRAHLQAGEPAYAARDFAQARKRDPTSPVLVAWHAHALAEAGDLDQALSVAEAGITEIGPMDDLVYNRAAYLARKGQLDEAAAVLRPMVADGRVTPREVAKDADFEAFAGDERFTDLVPPEQVRVRLVGEGGAVLMGELFNVELHVESREGLPLSITDVGEPPGLLHHVRTVEDVLTRGDGLVSRKLEISWRAVDEGEAMIGPWMVAAGKTSAVTDKAAVTVTALPGQQTKLEPEEAESVFSPAALLAGKPEPWAGQLLGGLVVKLGAGMRHDVAWSGPQQAATPPAELVFREAGQPVWTAWLYRRQGEARVMVTRKGQELLAETITVE